MLYVSAQDTTKRSFYANELTRQITLLIPNYALKLTYPNLSGRGPSLIKFSFFLGELGFDTTKSAAAFSSVITPVSDKLNSPAQIFKIRPGYILL